MAPGANLNSMASGPNRRNHRLRAVRMNRPLTTLDLTFDEIEQNLACDEALLMRVERQERAGVLRFWEFPRFAVVLGASSRLHDDVRLQTCRDDGVLIARRASGGGTVVIGPGALNVTVVLPIDSAPELKAVDTAQRYVLERCANALRTREPSVTVEGLGDLAIGGKKIAGSAQRRLKRAVLVHLSLLYDFPLERITNYLNDPARQPAYRENRSHADFVANLHVERSSIRATLRAEWVGDCRDATETPALTGDITNLVRSKYALPSWVERL